MAQKKNASKNGSPKSSRTTTENSTRSRTADEERPESGKASAAEQASGEGEIPKSTFEDARENLTNILDEISQKANEIEEKVRKQLSEGEVSLKDEIARTEEKIRENPLLAVGVAAAAGLVLGLLLNRNR